MILGLTGGMGCGKTTAAGMLAAYGYVPLDSDAIIRTVLLTEKDVVAAIREHFGAEVLAASGAVDRGQVARRVFTDPAALGWLENLLHPRLYAYWRAAFAAGGTKSWVVEVPLLFEKSLQNWFDFTVCVASHPTVQLARLEQRGLPPPLARPRISMQLPLAQKIELVDFVLLNDGSTDFLREQVAQLVNSLSSL
ncbi:MAG: dephospho-CoA kinase [Opitutaceae bacterium]|jgi:dephospho-CoA kinase